MCIRTIKSIGLKEYASGLWTSIKEIDGGKILSSASHQIVFVSRFFFWNFFLEFFFLLNNLLPFCPCISVTNKSDY